MSKKWEELTRAERRVEICKDALKQLERCDFTGEGAYIQALEPFCRYTRADNYSTTMITKEEVELLFRTCQACARGGLLLARIHRFNSIPWRLLTGTQKPSVGGFSSGSIGPQETTEGLKGAFSEYQLCLIECAFEQSVTYINPGHAKKSQLAAAKRARSFGMQFRSTMERMMAICQNIIDHDGEFRPTVEYTIVEY